MPCKVSFDISGKVDEADYNLIRSKAVQAAVNKFEAAVADDFKTAWR